MIDDINILVADVSMADLDLGTHILFHICVITLFPNVMFYSIFFV